MGTDHSKPAQQAHRERRGIWWMLFLLSIVAIIVAGISLTKRIGAYYERVDHPLFAYNEVASTDFTFAGRDVSIEEIQRSDDSLAIRVEYADESLELDVVYPPKHALPTLFDRQREWFGMYFFADRSGMTLQEFEEGIASDEIQLRLAIVTRTPFGVEPAKDPRHESIGRTENETTGEARRDLFRYDFYEFKRDGTIELESKRFPESGKSFMRRRVNAELRGEPEPERADDEIREYTWQWGAAIKVTNRPPPITQERQALLNAGWTLPVAAGGFLMLAVSFFFAIAPPRVTEENA
ncbi:MAG: hypothetical protein JJ916_08190 [Phycisphaerales bacterium]|nr:hypothetical protein [Phycisphaerales bacterium]